MARNDEQAAPVPVALEIRLLEDKKNGPSIKLTPKRIDRFTMHGFGLFLEDIQDGEVAITDKAREALLSGRYRSGLMAMEFFAGGIIGYCASVAALNEVSVHPGAADYIRKFAVLKARG